MSMSLTAYAKRRGVSAVAVSKAVATDRLVQSVGRNDRGQPVILDPELADREWTANTRRRADQSEALRSPRSPDPPRLEEMPSAAAAYPSAAPAPAAAPPFHVSRDLRAAAAARREAAAADLAELELAAKRGEVVDAARARADVIERYTTIKTRLLAIPSALGQRLPALAAQVVPAADELVRAALLELATGKIADDGDAGA